MATDTLGQLGMIGIGRMRANLVRRLTADAPARSPKLEEFTKRVSDSVEGRWSVLVAVDEGVPAAVITTALTDGFQSRGPGEFADRILPAMRGEFNGHDEKGS
ncbi:hypothetical protein ABZ826_21965 [Streptomyces sp. NPDC047515]|uniref:hypothetical protein n=1 Tax=Streptomyces sp. NPDC047515 TaxID=3155380 RepID=UPI0033CF7BED